MTSVSSGRPFHSTFRPKPISKPISSAPTAQANRFSIVHVLRSVALPAAGFVLVAVVDHYWRQPGADTSKEKLIQAGYVLLGCALAYQLFCVLVLDFFFSGVKGLRVPNILKHILAMVAAGVAIAVTFNLLFSGAVAGFLTLSSVIGIVIGLALRPIILDVFSGISANLDTAFRIGDWVEIRFRTGSGGVTGWVEEINWRTTRIRTRSGNLVICPNSAVGTSVITNFTRPGPLSRFEVPVKLPQEVEVGRALGLLRSAVESVVGGEGGISPASIPMPWPVWPKPAPPAHSPPASPWSIRVGQTVTYFSFSPVPSKCGCAPARKKCVSPP